MKKKAIIAIMMAAIMALSAVTVWALSYDVPEDATTVTARFYLVDPYGPGDEFAMVSEDGELTIHVTEETIVYFEDYVPLGDDDEGLTRMAREVLFGRSLAEVLAGRNLRVIFVEGDYIEPISIMILFEGIVALGDDGDFDMENGYMGIVPLPEDIVLEDEEINWDGFEYDQLELGGEVVVNGVILENAPLPFLASTESGYVVMVPLRAIAEALDYQVTWNQHLRSVQLGAAVHLWIGGYEAHVGRMAPIELSTPPVLVNNLTFVPLDFIRNVLNQTVYVFEGQVVVETYSDMM